MHRLELLCNDGVGLLQHLLPDGLVVVRPHHLQRCIQPQHLHPCATLLALFPSSLLSQGMSRVCAVLWDCAAEPGMLRKSTGKGYIAVHECQVPHVLAGTQPSAQGFHNMSHHWQARRCRDDSPRDMWQVGANPVIVGVLGP
jgi:hypothetical protein